MLKALNKKITAWLAADRDPSEIPLCDFDRIRYEVRLGDVLLVEGRSHISDIIKYITQSSWSHAAIYIGRIHDIEDPAIRAKALEHFEGLPDTQLLIEGVLGKGTVITPLNHYKQDHIRICRPRGLSPHDTQNVIEYAVNKLGYDYDVRQILDLMRFMLPWPILPRSWRSSLFKDNPSEFTRTVCSSIIAEAFNSVHFPILPHIKKNKEGIEMYKINPRIFTPRDFDYSPYFDIIKYPFVSINEEPLYRRLPWNKDGVMIRGNEKRKRKAKNRYEDDGELYE